MFENFSISVTRLLCHTGRRVRMTLVSAVMILVAPAISAHACVFAQSNESAVHTDAAAYARYVEPGQCVEGFKRLTFMFWRERREDTVRYAPETDSVPTKVQNEIKPCVARFSVANVSGTQLRNLIRLYLVTNQDALAQAAADKWIASAAHDTVGQRAWVTELAMQEFLNARPTRLAIAKKYLAKLDALGNAAAYERLSAHKAVAEYAWSIGDAKLTVDETHAALVAEHAMSHGDQVDMSDSIANIVSARALAVAVTQNPAAANAVVDSGGAIVLPLTNNGTRFAGMLRQRMQDWVDFEHGLYTPIGQPAEHVHADYWYGVTGDSVFPKPGKVTLLILLHPAFGTAQMFATLRRLHDEYAAKGLDLVYMTYTTGFFRSSLEPKPADEANRLNFWFRDFNKLQFPLAVEESQFGRLPDGRRENTKMSNQKNFWHGTNGILVGKDGNFRLFINVSPGTEKILDSQIERALKQ